MAALVEAPTPIKQETTTMQYDGSISSEGKFHGKGSIVYSNGERYAGDWEHGQRHGTGVYTYADGGSYDGQWDRDKISGEGRARYADGNVYEGSWVNGKIHGTGKLETSKFSYDGEWRDGKKHGEGSCRYHDNGDDYEGSWAEDKWHGHGVWTLRGEDGSVHEKFVGDMPRCEKRKRLHALHQPHETWPNDLAAASVVAVGPRKKKAPSADRARTPPTCLPSPSSALLTANHFPQ